MKNKPTKTNTEYKRCTLDFLHITKISHTGVFRDGKVNDFKLFMTLNEIKDILTNFLHFPVLTIK